MIDLEFCNQGCFIKIYFWWKFQVKITSTSWDIQMSILQTNLKCVFYGPEWFSSPKILTTNFDWLSDQVWSLLVMPLCSNHILAYFSLWSVKYTLVTGGRWKWHHLSWLLYSQRLQDLRAGKISAKNFENWHFGKYVTFWWRHYTMMTSSYDVTILTIDDI